MADPKKDYRPPTLIVYGNIREITNTVGPNGMGDGGGGTNNMTSL